MVDPSTLEKGDPWGRSALSALRRYWWLVAIPAVIAGLLGFTATKRAPVRANAYAFVQSSPDASAADAREAETATAVEEAQTDVVYAAAARSLGISPGELRGVVKVGLLTPSQAISFQASAPTEAEAIRRANAMVNAAIGASSGRVKSQVKAFTTDSSAVLREQRLGQRAAEVARVEQLGTAVGDAQASLVSQSRRLGLLQPATDSQVSRSPVLPISLASLLGGAFLGVATVLLIGPRRGRVRGSQQIESLFPASQVLTPADLPSVVAAEAGDRDLVALTGLGVADRELESLMQPLSVGMATSERDLVRSEDMTLIGKPRGGKSAYRDMSVLMVPASAAVIRRVMADDHALLIVAVKKGRTRIDEIDALVNRLRDNSYLVVC